MADQEINRISGPIQLLPGFSGEPGYTASTFLAQVESVARLGNWDEGVKILAAKGKLKGKALEFLGSSQALQNAKKWDDFTNLLKGHFDKEPHLSIKWHDLMTCKQKNAETVINF